MGILEEVIAHLENQRGRIKRRGFLDVLNADLREANDNTVRAFDMAASTVPEVREAGQEQLLGGGAAWHWRYRKHYSQAGCGHYQANKKGWRVYYRNRLRQKAYAGVDGCKGQ